MRQKYEINHSIGCCVLRFSSCTHVPGMCTASGTSMSTHTLSPSGLVCLCWTERKNSKKKEKKKKTFCRNRWNLNLSFHELLLHTHSSFRRRSFFRIYSLEMKMLLSQCALQFSCVFFCVSIFGQLAKWFWWIEQIQMRLVLMTRNEEVEREREATPNSQ